MVICPECGQEFANTRGLGTHRHYAHGYQGEIRVKPDDLRGPEVAALSRRLARMERKLDKCLEAYKDLQAKLQAVRQALK